MALHLWMSSMIWVIFAVIVAADHCRNDGGCSASCSCNCAGGAKSTFRDGALGLVVTSRGLPDGQFTASTERGSTYLARRVRWDNYFDTPCSWLALTEDPEKWIEVDIIIPTVVAGIVVRKRCDALSHHTTGYLVKAWVDGSWSAIHAETSVSYTGDVHTAYFKKPVEARKWRVFILTFSEYPALKFDLIGYV